jgi:hypothetical protein
MFAPVVAMLVSGGDAEPSSTATTGLLWLASPVVATRRQPRRRDDRLP